MFARVPFKATASKKYYLVPGHQNSLIKPGTKITVFGLLPNGRWRCQIEREGIADLYCDAYGQPGLTIEINDKPAFPVMRDFSRLSIASEPGGINVASAFQKRPLGITKSNSLPSFPTDEFEEETGKMKDSLNEGFSLAVLDSEQME